MSNKLSKKEIRYMNIKDGWENVLAGFGSDRDKTTLSQPGFKLGLTVQFLNNIRYSDGLGWKVVTVVADDMTRAGFIVKDDKENKIVDAMKKLDLGNILAESMYWARLFGGALIIANVKNSGDLEEPLESKSGEVERLTLYDKSMVQIQTSDLYDAEDPRHGEPRLFTVTPKPGVAVTTGQFKVHESRCAWIKGEAIPENTYRAADIDDSFWGLSALQAIVDDVAALGTTNQGLANVMFELSISILKMGNMAEILAENNSKEFYDRMNIISMQKSMINMVLLGQDEEFKREFVRLGGVGEVVDKMYMRLQATSNIPKTKLTGEQTSGLSNNDDGSLQNYYTDIQSKQMRQLFKPLSRLAAIINLDLKVLPMGEIPVIDFNPVWEPTASKKVELMGTWAESMERFINMGVLSPEEVRKGTFAAGRTIFNIQLIDAEESNLKTPTDESKDRETP